MLIAHVQTLEPFNSFSNAFLLLLEKRQPAHILSQEEHFFMFRICVISIRIVGRYIKITALILSM